MKKVRYNCLFETDIVLSSVAASEGKNDSLDYIPGSKFLGIVASTLYTELGNEAFDYFHNGKVSFGDAHLVVNGERSLKAPLNWFIPKAKKVTDGTIFLHHQLAKTDSNGNKGFDSLDKSDQPKQVRTGYCLPRQELYLKVESNYSLKSQYDSTNKRSKESAMFGYNSLRAGTEMEFEIVYQDEILQVQVENCLVDKRHRVGRSRSAQYGLIFISKIGDCLITEPIELNNDIILYAESNWCIYNELGQSIATPTCKDLGIEGEIIWEYSQIRSREYQTWNQYRNTLDASRIIIEKGSVLYVQIKKPISSDFFDKGIGKHIAEGFGRVLINPDFLTSTTNQYNGKLRGQSPDEVVKPIVAIKEVAFEDALVMSFINNQKELNDIDSIIYRKVNNAVRENQDKFKRISSSQWGQVRNIAKFWSNYDGLIKFLFSEEIGNSRINNQGRETGTAIGFLMHGKNEEKWRNNSSELKKIITRFKNDHGETAAMKFTELFASKMAKPSNNE